MTVERHGRHGRKWLLNSGLIILLLSFTGCGGSSAGQDDQVEQLKRTVTALEQLTSTPQATETAILVPSPSATVRACGLDEITDAKRSVVRLESNEGTGSGFLLKNGTIVTNAHMVGYSQSLSVQFGDGTRTTASVFSVDETHDLALLVPAHVPNSLGLEWGDSSLLRGSQTVIAIGFPLGLAGEASVARGSVSRTVTVDGIEYIQTDTALNFGNSGGPLLDECGKVVGVVTWGISVAEGLGFAVSEREARSAVATLAAAPSSPRVRTPVETVEQFLSLIDQQEYNAAYGLLSSR